MKEEGKISVSSKWTTLSVGDEFLFHMPHPATPELLRDARRVFEIHSKYNCFFVVTNVNHDDISATFPVYDQAIERLGAVMEGSSPQKKVYHYVFSWALLGQYLYVKKQKKKE
jgi:hypothetical protein